MVNFSTYFDSQKLSTDTDLTIGRVATKEEGNKAHNKGEITQPFQPFHSPFPFTKSEQWLCTLLDFGMSIARFGTEIVQLSKFVVHKLELFSQGKLFLFFGSCPSENGETRFIPFRHFE